MAWDSLVRNLEKLQALLYKTANFLVGGWSKNVKIVNVIYERSPSTFIITYRISAIIRHPRI